MIKKFFLVTLLILTVIAFYVHNPSEIAFTIKERDAHIESVAYDAVSNSFFFGSIHKRKILIRTKKGEIKDFLSYKNEPMGSVFGMKVDSKNRILWVCTGNIPYGENFDKDQSKKTEVLKIHIDKKKILKRYVLEDQEKDHLFGDLTIDDKGSVYITESGPSKEIYVIEKATDSLKIFLPTNLYSLQGICFSNISKRIFFADYGAGLYFFNRNKKEVTKLKGDIDDTGIDGLYYYKGSLIAVHNGETGKRVVKYILNKEEDTIISEKNLDKENPVFDEPTLGVIVGKQFYYVANSQWNGYKDFKIKPYEELKDIYIMKLKLE